MQNLHLIEVKYLPATNTRGSRIKATSLRFGDSVVIPFDYSANNIAQGFILWLSANNNDLGIKYSSYDEVNHRYILATPVFESIKAIKRGGVLV